MTKEQLLIVVVISVRNFDAVLANLKRMNLWNANSIAATAHETRGYYHYHLDHYTEAIAHFQTAQALDNKQTERSVNPMHEQDIYGFYYRGLARYRMGHDEEAIADLEKTNTLCQALNYETFQQKILDLLNEISSVE